ncbi:hypothetical protein HZH66_012791 [Vespula vulgaris]|uniref:Uncharacterized protein n=1 Tax=Vespula vulgaris TaxID=7454 RepID=A0A834J9C9_VESVU|nr:hypothetical protein HZH66_012791 [Vespula vulgaris]
MPDRRRLASCPQGFWWGDLKNAVLDGSPNRYHANVDTLRGVFSNVKLPIDLLRVCFVRCCYKIDPYGYVEACRMYQQDLTYFKGSPPWYFGCVGCKDFAGYNRRLSEEARFSSMIDIPLSECTWHECSSEQIVGIARK